MIKPPGTPEPKRNYASSSSFQMALLFTVLCGAAVIILAYFSYYFYRGHFVHGTEEIIETELQYLDFLDKQEQLDRHLDALKEKENRIYAVFTKPERPEFLPEDVSLLAEGIIVFDVPSRQKTYAAKIHSFGDGRKLLVGVDITDISRDFGFMQNLSMLSIIFMVIVVAVSFMISRFVVDGTNNIANTAYEIMKTGDLSRRVDVPWRWDDLSNMSAALNALLDRIQELMLGVRRVSDNIAHDLRTPLTRLRNHLETLKEQSLKNGNKETEQIADELLAEADQILSTFNAILRISRIEAERQKSQFKQTDLQAIIKDVIELYEPLAEEKDIKLDNQTQTVEIRGDRDLLFQMAANLLDNALKFTPENGSITITLGKTEDKTKITITDSGPGIPQEEIEKVFDRLYRGETSRHSPGTGLGLSLVKAVVELHDGTINLENTDRGLAVKILL